MRHPPDKPNPTPGAEGRADSFKQRSGGLSSKLNENYAPLIVFASGSHKNPALLARWYAVTPNSLVLGTFKSRLEAAQASGRRA